MTNSKAWTDALGDLPKLPRTPRVERQLNSRGSVLMQIETKFVYPADKTASVNSPLEDSLDQLLHMPHPASAPAEPQSTMPRFTTLHGGRPRPASSSFDLQAIQAKNEARLRALDGLERPNGGGENQDQIDQLLQDFIQMKKIGAWGDATGGGDMTLPGESRWMSALEPAVI
mmetsp:Transcript_36425/g.58919  ORF Transcript_36425/g.58919 Transcript_36425/m.58919 type:complete len:172 (+) Transcript_36425:200-715(+)